MHSLDTGSTSQQWSFEVPQAATPGRNSLKTVKLEILSTSPCKTPDDYMLYSFIFALFPHWLDRAREETREEF